MRRRLVVTLAAILAAVVLVAAGYWAGGRNAPAASGTAAVATGMGQDADAIARARGLKPADVAAALKTYVPSGQMDEYVMFASGGHSGQVFVIGLPSMRQLKTIPVFTPEPWVGWGYSNETREVLAQGDIRGEPITWADTHHPGLSETKGEYDGEFLFINDKSGGRVAVIDLRDFETKQIVKNPLFINDHGSTFVTPNTEYVIEGSQYAVPLGWKYAPLTDESYRENYRGLLTFWKFDRAKGRIDPKQSWAIELPPYWQDLCDAGKGPSDGLVFCNSIDTELAIGGIEKGNPPFEAGASQRDMDYMHVVDWKKAEQVVAAGKVTEMEGMRVIRLEDAVKEQLLWFVPEPKSPHGVDVTPKGTHVVVGGKLDPHVSIYSVEKLKAAMQKEAPEKDLYGVPVLDFKEVLEAQVEVGLGPLHTVYDNQGYAYTSLFLDSAVARWTLGSERPQDGWKLISKTPVQYNVGHLAAAEGDTVSPDGKYLVALNKWSIDRFLVVGPLHPQNLQLMDISAPGETMPVIYDMAMGVGEPHYAQIIKADKLKGWKTYPEIGYNPLTMSKDPHGIKAGEERVVREGNKVEIWMSAIRSHYNPEHVEVKKGDHVIWHITNIETARDATHGFALPGYNFHLSLEPGETGTIEFVAKHEGVFTFYCTEFCSALHLEMTGYFLVKP
ncbi:MAG: Sec-dependent nitrous-oxide reductase [Bacillota bacterium]